MKLNLAVGVIAKFMQIRSQEMNFLTLSLDVSRSCLAVLSSFDLNIDSNYFVGR